MEKIKSKKISPSVSEDSSNQNELRIEAKDVKVWYGDFNAIKGIDMKIKPNTVTAFIGPSGCGKSTFLRLFNRMNDYVEGFKMDLEKRASKTLHRWFHSEGQQTHPLPYHPSYH